MSTLINAVDFSTVFVPEIAPADAVALKASGADLAVVGFDYTAASQAVRTVLLGADIEFQPYRFMYGSIAPETQVDSVMLGVNNAGAPFPRFVHLDIEPIWTPDGSSIQSPPPTIAQLHAARLRMEAAGVVPGGVMQPSVYCVTPDARVLTRDLEWVQAGDLRQGDSLLSFDETCSINNKGSLTRRYRLASITAYERKRLPTFEIELATGQMLVCTGEHRWLTDLQFEGHGGEMRWVSTEDLARAVGRTTKHAARVHLPRYMTPWQRKDDYATGFLGAAFDGEGCLQYKAGKQGPATLSFVQKENAMLARVKDLLDIEGYSYRTDKPHGPSRTITLTLRGGIGETLRFLGQCQPPRLMDRFRMATGEGNVGRELRAREYIGIESIRYAGEREIAAISSSSQTYFAEGFGAHNTSIYVWNNWYAGWTEFADAGWWVWIADWRSPRITDLSQVSLFGGWALDHVCGVQTGGERISPIGMVDDSIFLPMSAPVQPIQPANALQHLIRGRAILAPILPYVPLAAEADVEFEAGQEDITPQEAVPV